MTTVTCDALYYFVHGDMLYSINTIIGNVAKLLNELVQFLKTHNVSKYKLFFGVLLFYDCVFCVTAFRPSLMITLFSCAITIAVQESDLDL